MICFQKLSILLTSLSVLIAAPLRAEHIKVFLLGGQSNMLGNNTSVSAIPTTPINLQLPQDDVLFYYGTNSAATFVSLQPGGGNNFGPEITFGRTIANALPNQKFCIIKHAQGATNLHTNWDPVSGTVYSDFRRTVSHGLDALTKAGHTYQIVGMLWTQGENDVQDGRTTSQYEADLNEFIGDIRTRYGANLPFFISRLSSLQTWRSTTLTGPIRTAQENVDATDPFAYLINTDAMGMQGDNLHFTGAGIVSMGQAFAAAYLATVETNNPTIQTLSPAHTSTVDPTANLSITFNENVVFGSGVISLRQTGGALIAANVTLSGATVTIDPSSLLSPSTGYYIEIGANAVKDLSNNSFGGFGGDGTWNFTTSAADNTQPAITSLSPAHSATGVLYNSNLRITFTENVVFGTDAIRLCRLSDNTVVETYNVANPPANLTLSGSTLTINPTSDLGISTGYYLEIDANAIDDQAGNSFSGFSGSGTWSFTTPAALIHASKITATASIADSTSHPSRTVDGSGLSAGVHGTETNTYWNTPTTDPINHWIQWDLGASYTLDSIQIWNFKNAFVASTKSVDIYFSNATIPGDPEGVGSGNWTRLGGASVELPEATTPNNGFYLANLPSTEVRYIRFELNTNWGGNRTGLSEIQFTAKPSGPDTTAPSVTTRNPAHMATGVTTSSNLAITFNENVAFGTGAIHLYRENGVIDTLVESFNAASPPGGRILSGATVTLNPAADLSLATTYYIEIETNAIKDTSNNPFPGFTGDGIWRFTTVSGDTTRPTISSRNPAHNSTGISVGSNLVVTFSENVAFGTGAISIRRLSDNFEIESFNVASPPSGLILSGATVTLNPTADLSTSTTYYVEIGNAAIKDLANNFFDGITGSGTWSFTTFVPDTTPPTFTTRNPANGATGISPSANLQITFSENVAFGTGTVTLRQSGGALVESFNVSPPSSVLTLSGAMLTLNPSNNLALSATYYVEIGNTAIKDLANNFFPGITGNGTWSFTTSASASSAAITFVGAQMGLEDTRVNDPSLGWRNTGVVKTLDIDTDNIVGTDGWRTSFAGANPSYLTSSVIAPNANGASGNGIDNPTNPSGADNSFNWLHDNAAGLNVESVGLLRFVMTNPVPPGETLRVGVLFDGRVAATNRHEFKLKQTVGGSASATSGSYALDAMLDVAYFDVTGMNVGDTFEVTSKVTLGPEWPHAFEHVIGITFDTGVISSGNTFANWIGGFSGLGGLTAFNDDADRDGIKNGVEAFFGTAPNSPSSGLSAAVFNGSSITFTHSEADPQLTNVTGSYEWSLDLTTWKNSGEAASGTTVTIGAARNTPQTGKTTVTATLTGTAPTKIFVRAAAKQN